MKENSVVLQSASILSFGDELEKVKEECEFEEALALLCNPDEADRRLLEAMCKIITEMRRKPEKGYILIDKEAVSVAEVKEVYAQIGADELSQVLVNFKHVNYEIKFIKAWLRTALYNSVFETEARMTNDVNVFVNGGGAND